MLQVVLTIPEELEEDWKADRFTNALRALMADAHEARYSTYPPDSWSTEEDERYTYLLSDMIHGAVDLPELTHEDFLKMAKRLCVEDQQLSVESTAESLESFWNTCFAWQVAKGQRENGRENEHLHEG